jgi:hypothetical protein
VHEAVNEMFDLAIPRTKKLAYIGHLNEILCFINAAKRVAPAEADNKIIVSGKITL